jgi:hypothetical protein
MTTFPISFEFAGVSITATVWRIPKTKPGQTVQFHVYDMVPAFEGVPEVWMFIHNEKTGLLEFSLPSPDFFNMPVAIINAIREGCEKRVIEYV